MTSKVKRNKREKERAIKQAATKLFTEKGFQDTLIDEIVKEAGVGKGTFYLYFTDKYELLQKIVAEEGVKVLHKAAVATEEQGINKLEGETLFFIDSLINYLKNEKEKLQYVYKNISWQVVKRAIETHSEVREIYDKFHEGYGVKRTKEEVDIILFMVIDLVSSVAYTAITSEEPASLETVKPLLYESVKKIISI